jgi:hypothetical protein
MSCISEPLAVNELKCMREMSADSREAFDRLDYDIHGIVGLRVLACPPSNAAGISRKLGLLQRPLLREPDIVVRFVDKIEAPVITYLGLNQYGFTSDKFFIFSDKTGAKIEFDFEQAGQTCEVICETGAQLMPLLLPLINLTALGKGYVSLHASAFVHKGNGILVTGWKKGGKTESLLAFAAQGARYLGDEWILISADGKKMYGIPGPVPLWDWHLEHLPHLKSRIKLKDRLWFKSVRWLDAMQRRLPQGKLGNVLPLRFLRDALPPLKRRLNVAVEPESIFTAPLGTLSGPLDKVFLGMSHDDQGIRVEPIDPLEIAERMSFSVQSEQLGFFRDYLAFKFAFPGRRADFMERAAELQREMLRRVLAGKDAHLVLHPYPVPLNALSRSMQPFCESSNVVSISSQRVEPSIA